MGENDSKALALNGEKAASVSHVPTDDEIAGIRKAGLQMTEYRKELNSVAKRLEGMQWGTVSGASMSIHTRFAMAEFCHVTRANAQYHLDILGGKPYLNAKYWEDLCNQHDYFHHYEQRDLSTSVEQALRDRAKRHRDIAKDLTGEEAAKRLGKALDFEEEADDLALARAIWSPPPGIQVVVQTTIYRFANQAPLDRIRSGEIEDFERYLITVAECNWAGGKKSDPVGDSNPALTARTRSFRRAATKAFSAWMAQYEQQIQKAEEYLEAEYEVLVDDARKERASLPPASGPQAVGTGNGEPEATHPDEAKDLPVKGEIVQEGRQEEPTAKKKAAAKKPEPKPEPPKDDFDRRDAAKRFFATFRDAGHGKDDRKEWQAEHGFPDSTNEWTKADFERADGLLVGPVRERVKVAVGNEKALKDLSLRVLGKELPQYLRDWNALDLTLKAQAGAAEEEDDDEGEL